MGAPSKLVLRCQTRESGFKGQLRGLGPHDNPCLPTLSRRCLENGRILLANSTEHNLREKICSYHGAKLDENRTSTPTNSTIMQSIGAVCRLVVISPAVSSSLLYPAGRREKWRICWA